MKIADLEIHRDRNVDMSPDEIERRLDELEQLFELVVELRTARCHGPREPQTQGSQTQGRPLKP